MWQRIDNRTEALLVPGGMVIRTVEDAWPTESTATVAVAMVFVPSNHSVGNSDCEVWISEKAAARKEALGDK